MNIHPLLQLLYGNVTEYADAKRTMLTAWKRAAGIEDDDDPADPRTIAESFTDLAQVVTLTVNQPTPRNDGTLIVPYTLRLHCDEGIEVPVTLNGQAHSVTMDIGLSKPLFLVESQHWQPVQDTILRARKHPNVSPGPIGDSVWLVAPVDGQGRIVGEPLETELHIVMEQRGIGQDGPITLSVRAPRDGFDVSVRDATLSATQKDVLDAIFARAIPRDSRNRLEVASVSVKPGGVKVRE